MAPTFSETKKLSNFFLDACCWLSMWQTVTSEPIQPPVVAINKKFLLFAAFHLLNHPNSAVTGTAADSLTLLNIVD